MSPFLRSVAGGSIAAVAVLLVWAAFLQWQPGQSPTAPSSRPKLDVPYVQTLEEVVERMLALAEVGPRDHIVDLGSGDGRILIAAARTRGASGYGVDLDPARVREARDNARRAGVDDRVRFEVRDLFATPISDATVVAIYLLPEVNLQLRPRFLSELRPGARVVSHTFDMGDWRPDKEADVEGARVFLWIVPAQVDGRWTFVAGDGRSVQVTLEQRYQQVVGDVREGRLEGDRFSFEADVAGGLRRYDGRVAGDRILPIDRSERWRMERVR